MNSSMAEQVLVKHKVESSNLSSSAYGSEPRFGQILLIKKMISLSQFKSFQIGGKTNGRIAPMAEHHVEAVTVLVRIQLRLHRLLLVEQDYAVLNSGQSVQVPQRGIPTKSE